MFGRSTLQKFKSPAQFQTFVRWGILGQSQISVRIYFQCALHFQLEVLFCSLLSWKLYILLCKNADLVSASRYVKNGNPFLVIY